MSAAVMLPLRKLLRWQNRWPRSVAVTTWARCSAIWKELMFLRSIQACLKRLRLRRREKLKSRIQTLYSAMRRYFQPNRARKFGTLRPPWSHRHWRRRAKTAINQLLNHRQCFRRYPKLTIERRRFGARLRKITLIIGRAWEVSRPGRAQMRLIIRS